MLVGKYLKLQHDVEEFDFDRHDEESARQPEDIAIPNQAQAGGKNLK